MDVTSQCQQVTVRAYQDSSIAPLKEVAGAVLAPIYPTSVAETQILQDAGKGDRAHLNSQVNMVGHQAKGVNTVFESFNSLLEQQAEPGPVCIVEENRLTGIAPQDDVIKRSGAEDPGFSSHDLTLSHKSQYSKPDPRT